MLSEAGLGARAFLQALPTGRTRFEPATFAGLRVRLHVQEAGEDSWCPKCDAVLDRFGHHAAVCVAGGERTLRHNLVRDLVFSWAQRAGLNPERERAGLLLGRVTGCFRLRRDGTAATGDSGAGLQGGRAYARHKEEYLGTAAACAAQGIKFLPMVVETTGNWDGGAARVPKQLADAVATRIGEGKEQLHALLLQELSVAVRSYRARAALRSRCELDE